MIKKETAGCAFCAPGVVDVCSSSSSCVKASELPSDPPPLDLWSPHGTAVGVATSVLKVHRSDVKEERGRTFSLLENRPPSRHVADYDSEEYAGQPNCCSKLRVTSEGEALAEGTENVRLVKIEDQVSEDDPTLLSSCSCCSASAQHRSSSASLKSQQKSEQKSEPATNQKQFPTILNSSSTFYASPPTASLPSSSSAPSLPSSSSPSASHQSSGRKRPRQSTDDTVSSQPVSTSRTNAPASSSQQVHCTINVGKIIQDCDNVSRALVLDGQRQIVEVARQFDVQPLPPTIDARKGVVPIPPVMKGSKPLHRHSALVDLVKPELTARFYAYRMPNINARFKQSLFVLCESVIQEIGDGVQPWLDTGDIEGVRRFWSARKTRVRQMVKMFKIQSEEHVKQHSVM